MKTITLLLLFICLSGSNVFAQLTSIPDPNFEQILIDLGYDTAPINGWVFTGNISSVTTLIVTNKNITDLNGIENFTALEVLSCGENQITVMDVSNNTNLRSLPYLFIFSCFFKEQTA